MAGKSILASITDRLLKTTYQNQSTVSSQIDIKDDSVVVNVLSKFILPILLVFGFYIHSHGDYTPGGGFQAGVIFACVLCLYYFLNLGTNAKKMTYNVLTGISMIGFLLYVGLGILGFFITGKFLDFSFLPFELANARGVFIVELGIACVVFSSVGRVFTTILELLKDIK